MEYEDRIVIPTPEGVEIDYVLAGLGSRFAASLLDWLLRVLVLGALTVVFAGLSGGAVAGALLLAALFAAVFLYDVAFEVWGGGQTPGKRWSALRVVRSGGQPVSLAPSAVRNLMRLVDLPLTLFVGGAIAIILSERNQRIGDLAADTIVIRESRDTAWTLPRADAAPASTASAPPLDLTGVSSAELAAVRDFLARRSALTSQARTRVARTLADAIAPKLGGLPPELRAPERILEAVVASPRDERR
jgi:uncharacterized RDD family membrane protein YckC